MKTYEPAFPTGPGGDTMHGEDGRVWHQYPAHPGMTLLDYFAGQVLPEVYKSFGPDPDMLKQVGEEAYATAAAMLEVRKSYAKGTQ